MAYYAYIIIGMDNDSFEKLGGEKNFQKSWKIVNNAHDYFIKTQSWNSKALKIKSIIESYINV